MSVEHKISLTWGAGGTLLGTTYTVSGNSEQNISETFANGVTDQALGVHYAANKLKSIFISVSKDCTLEINSSSAPTDTIALKADAPLVWVKQSGVPSPFVGTAGAVTNMYLTVPDTDPDATCDFELRAAIDL